LPRVVGFITSLASTTSFKRMLRIRSANLLGRLARSSGPILRRTAQSNSKVADESTKEFQSTVAELVSSRLFPSRQVNPVPVQSMCDAYRIQQGVAQCASLRSKEGGAIKGWKVGASNQAAIEKLGLDEAFRGPLFTPTLRRLCTCCAAPPSTRVCLRDCDRMPLATSAPTM